MIQNITFSHFTDSFNAVRPDNFSYQGLKLLFEYLTELEESCDMNIELDVIAICCDFSEYDIDELLSEFREDDETREDLEERLMNEGKILRQLNDTFLVDDNC